MTDRALQFIENNQKNPFFLYLSHWGVHAPIRARKEVVECYKEKLKALPAEKQKSFNPVYAGMIEAVDQSVGRVMKKVDELGLAENTLIVFTSDNGGLPKLAQLESLAPGQKGSLFEAGVRVATCMRWTKTIKPATTCSTPITSVDFLPTFASLAGAKLPKKQPIDGTDVSPLFLGDKIAERSIFWHYPLYLQGKGLDIDLPNGKTYSWRGFPSTSLLRGKWKLIEFHEDDSIGLYDLKEDPGETNNLAKKMPDRAAKLQGGIGRLAKENQGSRPTIA